MEVQAWPYSSVCSSRISPTFGGAERGYAFLMASVVIYLHHYHGKLQPRPSKPVSRGMPLGHPVSQPGKLTGSSSSPH